MAGSEVNDLIRRKAAALQEGIVRAFGDRAPVPPSIQRALGIDDAPVFPSAMPGNLSRQEIAEYFDDTVDAAVEGALAPLKMPTAPKPLDIPSTAGVRNDEVARRSQVRADVLGARAQVSGPTYTAPTVSGSTERPAQPLTGANPLAARWQT